MIYRERGRAYNLKCARSPRVVTLADYIKRLCLCVLLCLVYNSLYAGYGTLLVNVCITCLLLDMLLMLLCIHFVCSVFALMQAPRKVLPSVFPI